MVSFTLSTIFLGLAALSSALPSSKREYSKTKFAFSLQAEGYPALSLNAVQSGTLGNLDLVFQRPSAYPGTPAYFNGTILDFDLSDPNLPSSYGMYFTNVGDNYGVTVPVTAIYAGGKEGFSILNDGTLAAPMDAALEHFFACNGTVNGEDILQLKWGVFESNGESPAGCVAATLNQVFNVKA
ncbi:uncharacterized protein LY89DRAFT_330108 [Mollisia scopiformis]|uniref:DUF7907 domain-containing protein n=1 Tax=Mollisia scopiformis TaxID=149040 RepID=A0A132B7Q2_MOLSC|nr:uncharacterized protein LY89DRAFT_330108 [Mollisia scopiformis]KUJ08425.1 hypothetical protein LY89DRAFT_330108 [Mollisia scopiformis]